MLTFSFASVFIAILTSNVILIFLSFLFFFKEVRINLSLKLMAIFFLLAISRILFPFELPITTNLYWSYKISMAVAAFTRPHFNFYGYELSIWNVCVILWFLVFMIQMLWLWKKNNRIYHWITLRGREPDGNEKMCSLLNQILQEEGIRCKVNLRYLSALASPVVYRHHFQYWILLPEKINFSQEELIIVIKHELFHIRHHDLILKMWVYILNSFYWWNPLCYLLKDQVNLFLEMRVDNKIVDSIGTLPYLECLLKVEQNAGAFSACPTALGLCTTERSAIIKRFEMLTKKSKNGTIKRNLLNSLPVLFCGILYISSFIFIIESNCMPESFYQEYCVPTSENTFAIQNPDGSYDIYINGSFIENTDSLEYYPNDCPIIQK